MMAKKMALGGVTGALALVIMSLGGIIPVATYVCPMLLCMLLEMIRRSLGDRLSWVWYVAVGLLSLLLSPDKEAAAVFVFLGYYPIIRTKFPGKWLAWVLKLLYFNISIGALYWILIRLFAMEAIAAEFSGLGGWMLGILLFMGNITFFLLDRVLNMMEAKFQRFRAK